MNRVCVRRVANTGASVLNLCASCAGRQSVTHSWILWLGPMRRAVHEYDLPASAAALPVAMVQAPLPDALQPPVRAPSFKGAPRE